MKRIQHIRNAIGYILLFLGVQFLCSFAVTLVAQGLYLAGGAAGGLEKYLEDFTVTYTTAILCLSELVTILLVWCIARGQRKSLPQLAEGEGRVPRGLTANLLLAGLFGNVLTSGVMDLLPVSQELQDSYAQASSALNSPLLFMDILSVALLAPITEELIFRGLALSRLQKAMPTWLAVLLQGLVFGLIHGQILWMIYAACFGVLLGWVRVKTGSLRASMLLHIGFNTSSFFIGILYALAPQTVAAELTIALVGGVLMVAFLLPLGKLAVAPRDPELHNEQDPFYYDPKY